MKNIILGDTGYYNYVAGTNPDLRSKYNRTLGTWFHVCMTWSNEDRRTRIYLDGHLIETSGVTEREVLYLYMVGERCEIKNMVSDICSNEEDVLASIKVLSWDDVISNERSGNVSEILMQCEVSIGRLEENDLDKSKNKTLHLEIQQDEINCAVLKRLQNLEEELAESQNKTSQLEEKLLGKL